MKKRKISKKKLEVIIKDHKTWVDTKGAYGTRADLSNINFTKAKFEGINLSGVDLSYADLTESDLTHSNLSRTILVGAKLVRTVLYRATLNNANLMSAFIHLSDLSYADLTAVNFYKSNIIGTDLKSANLTNSSMSYTNLHLSDLTGAKLAGLNAYNTAGDGARIITHHMKYFIINFYDQVIQVGELRCPIKSLHTISDSEIENATSWNFVKIWKDWKNIILLMADQYAKETDLYRVEPLK